MPWLVYGLSLLASGALAAPWTTEPGFLGPEATESLRQRYPSIEDPLDLELLLQDLGRRYPSVELEARFRDGVWVIDGERASLIADIEIEAITRFLEKPLHAVVQPYIGEADAPEVRQKIVDATKRYMARRGYPEGRVHLSAESDGDGTVLTLEIDEGEPCLISEVELGFVLPQNVSLGIRRGDICDEEEITSALSALEAKLRDMGYNQIKVGLADIALDRQSGTAVVYVAGVLGQRIRYEVKDVSRKFLIGDLFSDDELTEVDPSIVGPEAMASELARRYRNRGFIDVTVKGPDVQKVGPDEFVYTYTVDPGIQYLLSDVQFEGVTVFTQEELLDIMGLTSIWQTRPPLNMDDIEQGLNALRAAYQERGYWDAVVRDPGTPQKDPESGTARLVIRVNEGMPRILRRVKVQGASAIPEDEIRDLLDVDPGDALDRAVLVNFQRDVRALYVNRGYLYAEVVIDLKAFEARRTVPTEVIVTVAEGPRVKIGNIAVIGLVRTKEIVVRRELLFESGDWYDPELINESRRALTRLGLFSSVQIVPADRKAVSDKAQELDLVVEVREGKAGNVSFGPGWKRLSGWNYTAEASYANIGGVGRRVSLRASMSEEAHQEAIGNKTLLGRTLGAGYVEPFIFGLPVNAEIQASHKAQARIATWELTYGGELALTHTLKALLPGSRVAVFYGQKVARTEGERQTEDDTLASNVRIGQTGIRYSIDRRDTPKFPTSGFTFDAEAAFARYPLGGDLRFNRYDFENNWFFGLTDDWVFALGISTTVYDEIERRGDQPDVLPFSERLLIGGSDTIRGFKPLTLGPLVRTPDITLNQDNVRSWDCGYTTKELGGTSMTLVRAELRYRISDSYATTGFVDSGNVFLSDEQMDQFGSVYQSSPVTVEQGACAGVQGYRTVQGNVGYDYGELLSNPGYLWSRHYLAYGGAFSILTPIGSINLAYGLPWREPQTAICKEDSEYCYSRARKARHWLLSGQFHLSVGARF